MPSSYASGPSAAIRCRCCTGKEADRPLLASADEGKRRSLGAANSRGEQATSDGTQVRNAVKKSNKPGPAHAYNIKALRDQEMEVARHAEQAYEHLVAQWKTRPKDRVRGRPKPQSCECDGDSARRRSPIDRRNARNCAGDDGIHLPIGPDKVLKRCELPSSVICRLCRCAFAGPAARAALIGSKPLACHQRLQEGICLSGRLQARCFVGRRRLHISVADGGGR